MLELVKIFYDLDCTVLWRLVVEYTREKLYGAIAREAELGFVEVK